MATFLGSRLLNKGGSEKETRHVEFDLDGLGLDYRPGDSFGVLPTNDPDLVAALVARLGVGPTRSSATATATAAAGCGAAERRRPFAGAGRAVRVAGDAQRTPGSGEAAGDGAGRGSGRGPGDARRAGRVGEVPGAHADRERADGGARPVAAAALFDLVEPPSDARQVAPDRRRRPLADRRAGAQGRGLLLSRRSAGARAIGSRLRAGLARLCPAVRPGDADRHGRPRHRRRPLPRVPARAPRDRRHGPCLAVLRPPAARLRLLLRRRVRRARHGRHSDAPHHRVLARPAAEGLRPGPDDRGGAELFRWLEDGAYFYVCGDAKRMAPDVDRALHRVVADHGGMDETGARSYVAGLVESGRYLKDVY